MDESGNIDETSVKMARELFQKDHSQLIQREAKTPQFRQPGTAPTSEKVSRQQNLADYVKNPRLSAQRAAQGLIE